MSGLQGRPAFFGEVLFDRFPDGTTVLGGAPFNVAWHLQAFGKTPLFISRIGDDPEGHQVLASMQDWGMNTSVVEIDPTHPTGSVDVRLNDGEPHFEIVADAAYDFISGDHLPSSENLALIYHGTLALRSEVSRATFAHMHKKTGAPLFLDVNLRAPWWQGTEVTQILDDARWLKLNDAELDILAPGTETQAARAEQLMQQHELDLVLLTRGANGALAVSKDGEMVEVAPAKKTRVIDTVGAGDAFASVVVLGLLEGWTLSRTLSNAQDLASRIVEQRGATPTDPAFYDPIRKAWNMT